MLESQATPGYGYSTVQYCTVVPLIKCSCTAAKVQSEPGTCEASEASEVQLPVRGAAPW